MLTPMEDQDIEILCQKFGIPDLVKKWLEEPEQFHHANEYRLHEKICDLHPEDALLCISLCLTVIHERYRLSHNFLRSLNKVALETIFNYGREALERFMVNDHNEDRANIEFVARDLRELSQALEMAEPFIMDLEEDALSTILSALSIQAGAQAEIARYVLTCFREKVQKEEAKAEFVEDAAIPFLKTLPVNDNLRH